MELKKFEDGIKYYSDLVKQNAWSVIEKKEINFALLEEMYKFVFQTNIKKGCSMCYYDAIFELINIKKNTIMLKNELQYQLVAGRIFKINGKFRSSKSIDLTNDECKQILKIYGKNAFVKIPKEGAEQVKIETQVANDKPEIISQKKSVSTVPDDFEYLKLKEMKELDFVKENFTEAEIATWKTKAKAIETIKSKI